MFADFAEATSRRALAPQERWREATEVRPECVAVEFYY